MEGNFTVPRQPEPRRENTSLQAVLVLAAGEAARFGAPKQLLSFGSGTLLEHVIAQAAALPDTLVAVVLGAHLEKIRPVVNPAIVRIIENREWKEGMGASVRKGIQVLQAAYPFLENCILTVCDQPYLSSALLGTLQEVHRVGGKGIVAASYGETAGTPALFHRKYFGDLENLAGDSGARALIRKYSHDLAMVGFPEGVVDIDTESDYRNLSR